MSCANSALKVKSRVLKVKVPDKRQPNEGKGPAAKEDKNMGSS